GRGAAGFACETVGTGAGVFACETGAGSRWAFACETGAPVKAAVAFAGVGGPGGRSAHGDSRAGRSSAFCALGLLGGGHCSGWPLRAGRQVRSLKIGRASCRERVVVVAVGSGVQEV